MAASFRCLCRRNFLEKHSVFTIFVRGSRYSKDYIDNTTAYDELREPISADDIRMLNQIKAAKTDDTTFASYDQRLQKFTNMIMRQGNKTIARDIMSKAFENIKRIQLEKYHKADAETKPNIELDPVKLFHKAIDNGKPTVHTVKVVLAGTTYQVPRACPERRQEFLSMKWLIDSCKEKERTIRFHDRLSQEIIEAANQKGRLIKKKQDLHKLCEANKAYANYRWM